MALVCPYEATIVRNYETLFVAAGHNPADRFFCQIKLGMLNNVVDQPPPILIKHQAYSFWLVPKHIAQKLAYLDV